MEIFSFICVILIICFLILLTDWVTKKFKMFNQALDIKYNSCGGYYSKWLGDLLQKESYKQNSLLSTAKTDLEKQLNETKEELDKLKFELKNPPEYYEGQKLKDGRICTKVEINVSLIKWCTLDWNKYSYNNVQPIERINGYFWRYEFATPKTKPKK